MTCRVVEDSFGGRVEITEGSSGEYYSRVLVMCDEECNAYEAPGTLSEYADTLRHYRDHGLRGGCSHGL